MSICIVDYGMGNIGSIVNMVTHLGFRPFVVDQPDALDNYEKVILPGVGHFGEAMKRMRKTGWLSALENAKNRNTWIMGICLGMQLMTRFSAEGNCEGLGWFDLDTKRFPENDHLDKSIKLPHMGWNTASFRPGVGFPHLSECERFYFVHSFFVDGADKSECLSTTEYEGIRFASGIQHGRLLGVQFHPEKSHRSGKALIRDFINLK